MIKKIREWWCGEFIPTPLEEILGETPPSERLKKPKTRVMLEKLWEFWLNRWHLVVPIIISIIAIFVALFIHFDSKTQSKPTQKQTNPKYNK